MYKYKIHLISYISPTYVEISSSAILDWPEGVGNRNKDVKLIEIPKEKVREHILKRVIEKGKEMTGNDDNIKKSVRWTDQVQQQID